MKKIITSLILLFAVQGQSFAINWIQLETPKGRIAYLDVDSITEFKNYYLYNIKFQNPGEYKYTVLTIQSSMASPLSARIKEYSEDEYKSLGGDYDNIAKNIKTNLETVTYDSVVNTCYRKVKEIKTLSSNSIILADDEPIEE